MSSKLINFIDTDVQSDKVNFMETITCCVILLGIFLNTFIVIRILEKNFEKQRGYFIESVYLLQLNTDIVEAMKYNLTNDKYR